LHTSTFDQHLILEFLPQGFLSGHLRQLKSVYARKMNLMANTLDSRLAGKIRFDRPEGGMFIWATLDDRVDTRKLFDRAIEQGVAFVPDAAFYENCLLDFSMRLNFTNSSEAEIVQGIDRLARLLETC
jgi:2-aminoadipate transaminase